MAKLHLERGRASRPWPRVSGARRALRAEVDRRDWIKQEALRAQSRLESRSLS